VSQAGVTTTFRRPLNRQAAVDADRTLDTLDSFGTICHLARFTNEFHDLRGNEDGWIIQSLAMEVWLRGWPIVQRLGLWEKLEGFRFIS
jgi:hypothetical protein